MAFDDPFPSTLDNDMVVKSIAAYTAQVLAAIQGGIGPTVPKTTNLLAGDGSGGISDSTIAPSNVLLKTGGAMTGKLVISGVTNDNSLSITGAQHTGTDASSDLNIASTWNTSGVITAFKLNITNTASDAASKLIDLQAGGSSLFSVTALGKVSIDSTLDTGDVTLVLKNREASCNIGMSNFGPLVFSSGLYAQSSNITASAGGFISDTPNGGAGHGTWKFGVARTSTGLVPSTTTGLQVDIGGTLYTLAILSTNP